MLIDWVTARVPGELLSEEARAAAFLLGDYIQRVCPRSGEVRYTTAAWDSIRSDSHQLACRFAGDLWVQGSPGRLIGDGDAVFGSGAAAALDLPGCVARMVQFLEARMGVKLPPVECWKVSRVDVTANMQLGSVAEVRSALSILRGVEGGRYRVSAQAGDTVYWSNRSKLRKGKAYAKGPHLAHLMKQRGYTGREYSGNEIEAADRLLRLELTLGREWFSRFEQATACPEQLKTDWKAPGLFTSHRWCEVTPERLRQEWQDYFGRMLGSAEVMDTVTLEERIAAAAPTEGQARAAVGCWVMIQQFGWERARELHSTRTWYRHMKILRAAGLGDADISRGEIVPLRRRVLEARVVSSWSELAA